MATLIPALGACVSRMTAGERRLAERLEQKLDDDYLLWYDVPMGPRSRRPTGTRRRHISKQARLPIASRRHVAAATRPRVNAAPLLDDSDSETELPGVMQVMDLHARHFHKWYRDQLVAFGKTLPANNMPVDAKMHDMVQRVIHGVDRKQIPSGQYQVVLIDEGHDFAPEWLRLVTQMEDPTTNSLLVLYDDAQSIYERSRSKQFSFKSVGIQAQGRTTILKINYRNTRQILQTASLIAKDLLTADDTDEDGIPLVKPISCGPEGEAPLILRLPNLRDEAFAIADHLSQAHKEVFAWGDMAVLCADWKTMDLCASALAQRKLPHRVRKKSCGYQPSAGAALCASKICYAQPLENNLE